MTQDNGVSENAVAVAALPEFTAADEGYVEADGFRIRYRAAGQGEPLVIFHGGGGMKIYRSHQLLAQQNRVILFEVPGFGASPVNQQSQSMRELALTMANAVTALGINDFNLMANSFGGKLALWLAVQQPERIRSLVLVAPAAIRSERSQPPRSLSQEELMTRLYAHPEFQEAQTPVDPSIRAKQGELVGRLMGPARDQELEDLMAGLNAPALVLIGTKDQIVSPDMGRIYCKILPNCNFILVYDAAHEADADRPEAFASLAGDFLQRQQGFLVNDKTGQIHP